MPSMIPPSEVRVLASRIATLEQEVSAINRSSRRSQLKYSSLQDGHINLYLGDEVRARIGQQSDGQAAVVYMGGDPPPQPSQPTVSARQLSFVVGWDGTFLNNAPKPSNLQRVDVHVSETQGFTPTPDTAWVSLFDKGAVAIPGDVDAKYVRLVAVSLSQVASPPSIESTITPLPADFIAAGAIGAEHLEADLILTSRIRMQDESLNTTLDLDGTVGSALISGEYMTALSGERIVINADSEHSRDIRFYPSSGDLYALVGAVGRLYDGVSHGTIEMRAANPSDGSFMTTRLWLLMDQLFLGYGHPEVNTDPVTPADWSGQVYIDEDTAYFRAGIPVIFSDINMGPFGVNEIHYRHMDASGTFIFNSELRHRPQPGGAPNRPNVYSQASNIGLVYGLDMMYVVHNNQAIGPLTVSALTQTSSRANKQNIRDVPYSALNAVKNAPSKVWEYTPGPAESLPGPTPGAGPNDRPQPQPPSNAPTNPSPDLHIGPMAEDLPSEVIRYAQDNPDEPLVDQGSMIGMLWKAVEEIVQRLEAIESNLPG